MIDEKKLIEDFKNTFSDSVLNQTFGFGKYTFLEAIEEMINRQPQIVTDTNVGSKWIQCSERLPKDNEMSEYYDAVIVTLDDGRVVNGCYRNRDEEWWVDAVDGEKYSINATDHVIAWQPLPEPYKE